MQELSLSGGRFQNCLRELRSRATDFEDHKRGIKITKKDWEKLRLHIVSYNNFPTAAGLASSAAGLACLGSLIFHSITCLQKQNILPCMFYFVHGSNCRLGVV